MEPITLRAHFYRLELGAARTVDSDLELTGSPDEGVLEALLRTTSQTSSTPYWLTWSTQEFPDDEFTVRIDDDLSMRELRDCFGDDLLMDPPVLSIDNGGRGEKIGRGGGDAVPALIEVVRSAFELAGIATTIGATYRMALQRRHSAERAAARHWDESGEASPELSNFVRARSSWDKPSFDGRFGLARHRASQLLKEHGYKRIDEYTWIRLD